MSSAAASAAMAEYVPVRIATSSDTKSVLLRAAKVKKSRGPKYGWKDCERSSPVPSNPNQMKINHSPILAVEYSPLDARNSLVPMFGPSQGHRRYVLAKMIQSEDESKEAEYSNRHQPCEVC
jgi:hypothetical protein